MNDTSMEQAPTVMGVSHRPSMNLRFVKRLVEGRELRILQQMFYPNDWNTHDEAWRDVPVHEEFLPQDTPIEQKMQDKGLTAPRVTLASIEACIACEWYITGDQIPSITTAVLGSAHQDIERADITPLSCLTICVLHLKNGFLVVGESACASPENFDAVLGRKIARQKAIDKVWMLEGYLLKEQLFQAPSDKSQ